MRRRAFDRRLVALAAVLAAGAPVRLTAQQVDNAGALFLVFPVGARTVGMGQTAAALDGRGEAAFWNPAGLATLGQSEFGLQTATLAAGTTHALTAYFPNHRLGVVGGSVYLVDFGDLDRTDANNNTIGRVSPRNLAFVASYATGVAGAVSLGVNYKLVEFLVGCSGDCTDLPGAHTVTHAVDLGGQFTVGPDRALRVGVAVRNIGFKLQANGRAQGDALPARVVVGALYRVALPGAPGTEPGERFDLDVAADVDRPWSGYGESQMRLGVDLGYQRMFRVRGGYAFVHDGLSGLSVGVGVAARSIGVDLARTFLTGSDLVAANPTFFAFRVVF